MSIETEIYKELLFFNEQSHDLILSFFGTDMMYMKICESTQKVYFAYILQDRRLQLKNKKYYYIKEVIICNISLREYQQLKNEKRTYHVYDFFNENKNLVKIGYVSGKFFAPDFITSLSEVADRFPSNNKSLQILHFTF